MRGWGQNRAPSQGRDRDSGPFPGAGQRQRGGPLPAEGAEAPGGGAEGAVGTDRWQREDRARAGKQSASATAWRGCAAPAPSLRWDTVTSEGSSTGASGHWRLEGQGRPTEVGEEDGGMGSSLGEARKLGRPPRARSGTRHAPLGLGHTLVA